MRYAATNGKVTLVGHSMGGVIVAGYMKDRGLGQVDKVVTLAAPFRGSIEAITKATLGGGGFGPTSSGSRGCEAARVTPSLWGGCSPQINAIDWDPPIPGDSSAGKL